MSTGSVGKHVSTILRPLFSPASALEYMKGKESHLNSRRGRTSTNRHGTPLGTLTQGTPGRNWSSWEIFIAVGASQVRMIGGPP